MTKPESGLFKGTSGIEDFYGDAERVIASRVAELDLREHPLQQSQLSSNKLKRLREKVKKRIATREDYYLLIWSKRLKRRRQDGVDSFWDAERERIIRGEKTTREWTEEQKQAIMRGDKLRFNGKAMESHHSYSVSKFPHLANLGNVIYPATHIEHLKGWHGGAYRNSKPGRRIRRIREF